MSDLFDNLSSEISKSVSNSKQKQTTSEGSKTSKTSASHKGTASKSENHCSHKKADVVPKQTASTSQAAPDNSFEKLAEIMATGFNDLKTMFYDQSFHNHERAEFEDYEEDFFDATAMELSQEDLFDDLASGMEFLRSVGPEVHGSLACLSNKMLQMKINDDVVKDKRASYLPPKNKEFLNAPRVNKPIWENISPSTRIKESSLQNIQKDFLASAIPVIQVMEKIFNAKEDLNVLDPKEIIDTLKDSLVFLGCANVGTTKMRRDNIKRDLPSNMHGLCGDGVETSSSFLFGDDLNASIKDVYELNKISNTFKRRNDHRRFVSRGMTRASPVIGRGKVFRRGAFGRAAYRRFSPYVSNNANKTQGRRSLNQAGPSRK